MLFRLHGRVAQNLSERIETMSQVNNLYGRTHRNVSPSMQSCPRRREKFTEYGKGCTERVGTYWIVITCCSNVGQNASERNFGVLNVQRYGEHECKCREGVHQTYRNVSSDTVLSWRFLLHGQVHNLMSTLWLILPAGLVPLERMRPAYCYMSERMRPLGTYRNVPRNVWERTRNVPPPLNRRAGLPGPGHSMTLSASDHHEKAYKRVHGSSG